MRRCGEGACQNQVDASAVVVCVELTLPYLPKASSRSFSVIRLLMLDTCRLLPGLTSPVSLPEALAWKGSDYMRGCQRRSAPLLGKKT